MLTIKQVHVSQW